MKIAILSFTLRGKDLNLKLKDILISDNITVDSLTIKKFSKGILAFEPSLKEWMRENFNNYDAFIFIGAAGIAVRTIAPFIISKDVDPAVIVMDEGENYIIPILSGHIGGGNKLACKISKLLNLEAVITTATDINNKFAVDNFAVKNNLIIDNIKDIKVISGRLLEGKKVGFFCDIDVNNLLPEELTYENEEAGICISNREINPFKFTMKLIPKNLALGIGCRKNKSLEEIESLVFVVLKENNICIKSIKGIYSIDLKAEEKGILDFSKKYNIPFKVFSAEELNKAVGSFTKSSFVTSITGVDNVCERAAVLGSNMGEIEIKKTCDNGVTVAVAKEEWSVLFE